MSFQWKTIRYDNVKAPGAWQLALQLQELAKDLRASGARLHPAEAAPVQQAAAAAAAAPVYPTAGLTGTEA